MIEKAYGAPQTIAAPAVSGADTLLQVTLVLALMLALLFAVVWWLRRVRTPRGDGGTALEVLANVPLGVKERAVLLRFGPNQLLVGVTPSSINTLHVLPLDAPPSGEPAPRASAEVPRFKDLLLRSLGR
jgi:flagellar protein FliO/FliZ